MNDRIKQLILDYGSQKIARITLEDKKAIADLHDTLIPYDKGRATNWNGCQACFNKSVDRLVYYINNLTKDVEPQPTVKRSKKRGRPTKNRK